MWSKVLTGLGSLTILTTTYSIHKNYLKIEYYFQQHQYTELNLQKSTKTFTSKSTIQYHRTLQNPQYSLYIFRKLLQYQLLVRNTNEKDCFWKDKILGAGFDIDGRMISGIKELEFKGVQVGPISYQCTPQGYPGVRHLGIMYALANISTFRSYQSINNNEQQFIIGISLSPDYEVSKFTPYLLKQNIINAYNKILSITHKINFVTINLNTKEIQEYIKFVPEQHPKTIQQLFKDLKNIIYKKPNEQHIRPKLYLQVAQNVVSKFYDDSEIDKLIVNSNYPVKESLFYDRFLKSGQHIIYIEDFLNKLLESKQ